jgi:internalin A
VRTHPLSEGKARWRTGVVLKFEDNRALVKADVHDRKIFISVTGPATGRRRLLAVIRSDFERIHMNFRKLEPEEKIPIHLVIRLC